MRPLPKERSPRALGATSLCPFSHHTAPLSTKLSGTILDIPQGWPERARARRARAKSLPAILFTLPVPGSGVVQEKCQVTLARYLDDSGSSGAGAATAPAWQIVSTPPRHTSVAPTNENASSTSPHSTQPATAANTTVA